jgi:hypothetical protein
MPDSSREFPEEPLSVSRFFLEGLLGQLLLPIFYVRYWLNEDERALANLCRPLATTTAEMPVLWVLALLCLISIILIGSTASERSLDGKVNTVNVSLGDSVVALSSYFLVVIAAALSTAHAPREYCLVSDAQRGSVLSLVPPSQQTRFRPTRLSQSLSAEANLDRSKISFNGGGEVAPTDVSLQGPSDISRESPNADRPAGIMRFSYRVPYIRILFDEVPPLASDCNFVFPSESWFFPSRSNARYDRMNVHLEAAQFKFNIGQNIIRNNVSATDEEVDFGGELGVVAPNQVVAVTNRMWRESKACYALEGGDADLQYQPIEDFFVVFEAPRGGLTEAEQDNTNPNAMKDRVISSETMLLGMSKREILHRANHEGDGNFSGWRPVVIPLWASQSCWMLSAAMAFVPMILRGFAGVSPIGEASAGEVMGCFFPLLLNFLCLATIGRIIFATAISLWNFWDWVYSFTEVTLNGYPSKWHATLSFTDSINVHSWYALREQIGQVFQVGMRARCTLAGAASLHCFCWMSYYVSYSIVPTTRMFVDGWLLQQMCISALLLLGCCAVFMLCDEVNECFRDHAQFFSSVKVFVDEEVGALQRRQQRVSAFRDRSGSSKNNPLALEEVQGVITDVAFALHNESSQLQLFGVDVTTRVPLLLGVVAVLTLVCIAVAVRAMSHDDHRWTKVRSM